MPFFVLMLKPHLVLKKANSGCSLLYNSTCHISASNSQEVSRDKSTTWQWESSTMNNKLEKRPQIHALRELDHGLPNLKRLA